MPTTTTKEEKKSKFVHVPMYQVSYDYQHKGKVSSNTSRHKVRWIFGYASYDALKKKYIGDDCRDEEHELEFHLTSSLDKKKLRILHNGRILIEDIRYTSSTDYDDEDEENSNDEVIFEHDFTIKGKNHEAKLVILKDDEDSSSSFIINPQLSFGGLPFEDLPQTNEIQRNILSLYVAVPRTSQKSKKKHHHYNDYHHMLEEEDELNSRKEEERKERRKNKEKKKSKNDRASTGKMMYTNMTLNKEPKLHKLLDPNSSFAMEDTMKREAAKASKEEQISKNRAKSETNQRLGFMGSGHGSTAAAVDDDDEESDEVEEVGTDENLSSHHEPYHYDEEADVEQMIEQSLFLAEDQIDHTQEQQQEHWPDGRPKVMRSSSFASISSAGSSCSTVMDGTDSDDDDNDGSVYLDRSTRSMFDSSSSDESGAGKKSRTGSQAGGASSAANDDDDDDDSDNASISTAGSSVVGKMAELNVDDMLNHLINDSDDDSDDSDDDEQGTSTGKKKNNKTKGIPSSIKI